MNTENWAENADCSRLLQGKWRMRRIKNDTATYSYIKKMVLTHHTGAEEILQWMHTALHMVML